MEAVRTYSVGQTIRIRNRSGGFRVWKIVAVLFGGTHQEDHYQLQPLDRTLGNNVDGHSCESIVPMWLLETNPGVEVV